MRAAYRVAHGYHPAHMTLQALTLDLDDTLWPVLPTLRRAEACMQTWLQQHAPATGASLDTGAMRTLRAALLVERPDMAHDLGRLRRECTRRALLAAGDDPALAEPAFEVFYAARHDVALYPDVLPALQRLAARWPIVALSNGNADVQRVPGLGRWFHGAVSAQDLGVSKPAAAAFIAACQRAGANPAQTLHIGDDAAFDVDGALDAGLQAAWVRRPDVLSHGPETAQPRGAAQHVVADLTELADRLGC